jgi:tetratricopeptide (TPR) repeat protein
MRVRVALGFVLLTAVFAAPLLAAGGGGDSSAEEWSFKSKEFRAGHDAIGKQDFRQAIAWFSQAAAASPKDADAANYLGYAHRKLGDFESALKFYNRALELNPKHLGALEYLGEAYLELQDLPKAKDQLAKLDDICWLGCKEYRDLKAAIRDYEKKAQR